MYLKNTKQVMELLNSDEDLTLVDQFYLNKMNYVANQKATHAYETSYFPETLNYLQVCVQIEIKLGEKSDLAADLYNMACLYDELGQLKKAISHHYKSLKIAEELNDKEGIAYSYTKLGSIYTEMGNTSKAIENYDKGEKLFRELSRTTGPASSADILDGLLTLLNNMAHLYNNYGDPSIISSKEESKHSGRLRALECYTEVRNIEEKLGEELNTVNDNYEMLLVESNHRIKNNLQMILSMIEFNSLKSDNRSEELEKISGNIQAISTLHKYLSFDIHNQNVDLLLYLKEIVELYIEVKPQNFELNSVLKSLEIGSERIVYFGLIFNEMLSNTIEHSFHSETKIVVNINQNEGGLFSFSYSDSSSWNENKNTGLGTTLISGLVERINGVSYSLDTTQGTYYFEFDVEA